MELVELVELKQLELSWQKLGKFRRNNPSVKRGRHQMLSQSPYTFTRILNDNKVFVGLELTSGLKSLDVSTVFADEQIVKDAYSGQEVTINNGRADINTPFSIVLLEL